MFLKFLLVLACGVLPASVFADIVIKTLKGEIESSKKQINDLDVDSARLAQQLNQVTKEYEEKIFNMNIQKHNYSAEVKNELVKLEKLNSDIANHKQELQMVENEVARYNKVQSKTNLGLKWLEENVAIMESRRKIGEHNQCFKVDSSEPVVAQERSLDTTGAAAQNQSGSDNPDDVIALARELKSLKATLAKSKTDHNIVSQKLKEKNQIWSSIEESLTATMQQINGNLEKAKATVKQTEGELGGIKTKYATARQQLESKSNEKKQSADKVLKIKKTLQELGKDTACYSKIENHVLLSV